MRILIAGLGAIGQRHARNLRAILGSHLELLALRSRRLHHVVTDSLQCDTSRDVEHDLGATVFTDLDAAIDARPNAVFVCTPSSCHLAIAQRAADAGCHLFIEKPVSHTLEGLDRLRATVAGQRLVAVVGCQWRWHPGVRGVRGLIAADDLGSLTEARIDYCEYLPDWHPYEDYRTSYAARADLGGGVVLTQIHDYDLASWLFGPHRRVTASGGHCSDLEIDVEDTVMARLDGGKVAVDIHQTFAGRPPRRTLRVAGQEGSLSLDLLTGRVETTPSWQWAHDTLTCEGYPRNNMFKDEAIDFLRAVRGEIASPTTLEDGISVLNLALTVKAAMQSGRTEEIA